MQQPDGTNMHVSKLAATESGVSHVELSAAVLLSAVLITAMVAFPELSPEVAAPTAIAAEVGEASGSSIRLAVVGDTGTGGEQQLRVAGLIESYDDIADIDLLLILGDMIYEDGDPSLIEQLVLEPYVKTLDGTTSLVPVLGNHDVRTQAGGQIMSKLGAPGRWYTISNELLHLVVLDSTRPYDADQLQFLHRTLQETASEWVVVSLHHPPFSAGHHGSSQVMNDVFVPVFEMYGVDLVLSGHEHDYQRSHPINGITYVISGAGGKLRPTGALEFTALSASVPHFLSITIRDNSLIAEAVSAEGIIDRFELLSS
jgi:3',5'-cyclic AMP phosphodiesterase CpdA